jgi:hypothetical protein
MKISLLLSSALAASTLFLTSCDKKGDDAKATGDGGGAVSEKDALESFKKSAAEIKAMAAAGKESKDPMAQMGMVKPMLAKMQAIKTEGLPADLKAALTEAKAKVAEFAVIFKDMPEKKDEIAAWAQKTFTDPAIGPKMEKLGNEVKASGEKLKEVSKKYGADMDMGD